jgi:thiamine biosynthesis lipoprotein
VQTGAAGAGLARFGFSALGTHCDVQFAQEDAEQAAAFQNAAIAWVRAFEAKYSRFVPDSLVSRINAAAGREWIELDEEAERMFDLCGQVHFLSQGLLDVTALPLLRVWDWKAGLTELPTVERIGAALRLTGWAKVERGPGKIFLPEPGMAVDFGGWGKEYAVDMVAQIARHHGLARVLVDFGHDLCAVGAPPGRPAWHVGLEDPKNPGTAWSGVAVTDCGVASSGDYLRGCVIGGKRYGHIIDPRTGRPVANGCTQATVIAPTCLQAGLFSTTAFILGPQAGLKFIQDAFGAEGCLLTATSRSFTRGFHAYLTAP